MLEKVCGVLDVECFQHKQEVKFFREIAFRPTEYPLRVLFHTVRPSYIPSLENKALWKTFNCLKYKITGLDLYPEDDEHIRSGTMDSIRMV